MSRKIQIQLPYNQDVETALKEEFPHFVDYRILSQSLDARGANRGKVPQYLYHIEVILPGESFEPYTETFQSLGLLKKEDRPIIIGSGPAGLFCALRLLEYGVSSVLIERGSHSKERMKHIARYWRYGELNPQSNVCFGQGGAGLFSDGKLITRIKSPYIAYVMKKLVDFGADPKIMWENNPHLGSNKIRALIQHIGQYLEGHDCPIHYDTLMQDLLIENGIVKGVVIKDLNSGEEKKLYSSHIILATGHSARDTYQILLDRKIPMSPKDMAIGVRMEHSRQIIDQIQYGSFCGPELGASRYRLSFHDNQSKRGTYSFCMCPGGYVLSASTQKDALVSNGMSNSSCNSAWSNAAMVVSVKAGKEYHTVEQAFDWQKKIESLAFTFSTQKSNGYSLPAMGLEDFMKGQLKRKLPKTSCPSGVFAQNLHELFPQWVCSHLMNGFLKFDHQLKGLIKENGLLIGPETRTSSPVTIHRDLENFQSTDVKGLYPCGEGAGFAGGITSAAVDGIRVAQAIVAQFEAQQ